MTRPEDLPEGNKNLGSGMRSHLWGRGGEQGMGKLWVTDSSEGEAKQQLDQERVPITQDFSSDGVAGMMSVKKASCSHKECGWGYLLLQEYK